MTIEATTLEVEDARELKATNYLGLRIACWAIALALGAGQAWASRFQMNPDGISYMDIGDAYWRGDWHNAINAYWTPFYSWVLGLFLKILHPSPYWEYPAVHLANFIMYAGTLAAFEFFLSSFVKNQLRRDESLARSKLMSVPEPALRLLGYTLFLSSSLMLIGLYLVTPDLLVTCSVFLALGLILRIRNGEAYTRTYIVLGVVLGFGYFVKAVLLPLGFVFLATAACVGGLNRRSLRMTSLSGALFFVMAAPFITAISIEKGRPTFGVSGELTYAASINGVDPWYPGDGGRLLGIGTGYVEDIDGPSLVRNPLKHPPKKIFDYPPTYSFGDGMAGTYPFWYDPSYWQDGVKGHFDLHGQTLATGQGVLMHFYLLKTVHLNVLIPFLVLLLISTPLSGIVSGLRERWYLLLPCLSGIGVYALVHTEFRYVAAFVSVLWLILAGGLTFRQSAELRRFLLVTFSAVAATTAFFAAKTVAVDLLTKPEMMHYQAAQALGKLGLHEGDPIAAISNVAFGHGGAFVARLARLRVIAQVNRPDHFWAANEATQIGVLNAFQNQGCAGVLAFKASSPSKAWQRLGTSGYYFYSFRKPPTDLTP